MNQQIILSKNQIYKLYNVLDEFDYIEKITIETTQGYNNEIITLAKLTLFEVNDIIINLTEK